MTLEEKYKMKKVKAKTYNDIEVKGWLTIMPCEFEHIKPGYYISNSADRPFAYLIDPLTIMEL